MHDDPKALADVQEGFLNRGFLTLFAVNLASLERQNVLRAADVVFVRLARDTDTVGQISAVRAVAPTARLFLLADQAVDPDVAMDAGRAGAIKMFVQPYRVTDMVQAAEAVLGEDVRVGSNRKVRIQGINSLTKRERQVLELLLGGSSNKEVAVSLGISPRTIEVHRFKVMEKLGARNAVDMVRIVLGR